MAARTIVVAARLPWIRAFAKSLPQFRAFARRHIAGETLADAVAAARRLNSRGYPVTLNHLGTHVRGPDGVRLAVTTALGAIAAISAEAIDGDYSLKLTQFGLDFDIELCRAAVASILRAAAEAHVFIWIDMEEARYVDTTLELFESSCQTFGPAAVGIAVQSYLARSTADLQRLLEEGRRVRLVKGGYWESGPGFLAAAEVLPAFLRDIETVLATAVHPAIATHNAIALAAVCEAAERRGRRVESFELQMLLGVHGDEADVLREKGVRVRWYVPFGEDWYVFVLGCLRQVVLDRVRRRPARRELVRAS